MKTVLLTITCFVSIFAMAEYEPLDSTANVSELSEDINKKDAKGRKQGHWIIYGKDKPVKGYPKNGKIEEGNYLDNRKQGLWTKYHKDGKTPRIIGDFKNGRPKGSYKKLYPSGKVKEEGTFKNGQHTGSFKRFYPNGKLAQEKNFNTDGRENGSQKYYYPNGQLESEFNKINGVSTGQAKKIH